ncbi:hypothetical protein H671_6g16543 [Cricetulus griseus]|nr:hypothetical protein H671_6g16543 [Cricetulus griseus]
MSLRVIYYYVLLAFGFNLGPWAIYFQVLGHLRIARYVPVIPVLSKIFIMKECWILSKAFSASSEMIM